MLAAAIYGDKKSVTSSSSPSKPGAPVGLEFPPVAQPLVRGPPTASPTYVPPNLPERPQERRVASPQDVKLRPIVRSLYVTGKEVPIRAEPNSKAAILDRLPTGMQVGELARREGWVEVRHPISAIEGWMSTRRLSAKAPAEDDEADEAPATKPKTMPTPLDTVAIGAALIARSIASYPGSCPCPHNVDRGGRRCGGRSAHSRGGGRAPLCYQEDITPAMIANYRARGGR